MQDECNIRALLDHDDLPAYLKLPRIRFFFFLHPRMISQKAAVVVTRPAVSAKKSSR